jgi:hypothetical protein
MRKKKQLNRIFSITYVFHLENKEGQSDCERRLWRAQNISVGEIFRSQFERFGLDGIVLDHFDLRVFFRDVRFP